MATQKDISIDANKYGEEAWKVIESYFDGLLGTSRNPSLVCPNWLGIKALPRSGEKCALFRSWLS